MTVVQAQKPLPPDVGPEWYEIARKEVGQREILGPGMNPRIAEYYKATDLGKVNDDSVPWCSAFVNWCMREAGVKRTNKANARSWLYWGEELKEPRLGCVVVFSRPPNPASGHVALYVSETSAGNIWVLGGNQSNQVCVSAYGKARLLSYRWPAAKDMKPLQAPAPAGRGAPPLPSKK